MANNTPQNLNKLSRQENQNVEGIVNALQSTGFKPTYTPEPITSDTLASTEQPMNVKAPTPATEMTGLGASLTELATNSLKEYEASKKTQDQATQVQNTKQSLYDRLFNAKGESQLQDVAYKDAGVDTAKKELNDINQQILQEEVGNRKRIEALQKNPQGLFGGALTQEINRIDRESVSKRADLAVISLAKQGNYDLAKSTADRQVAGMLEQEKNQLEADKFNYLENKDIFTKSEQRDYEAYISEKESKLKTQESDLKTISDLSIDALKNGAPSSIAAQMRKAKTVDEAMTIGGQYVGLQDRRLQEAQLKEINAKTAQYGVPQITNPDAGKYGGALSVILGSSKFTKEQKSDIVNSINAGSEPFSVIKNQAKDIMGQTTATDLGKYETAASQLRNIDSLLTQYYANGGDTGIFKGNFEKTLNRLGSVSDAKLVNIATQIALAMQEYRLAVTGTAASVQEDARIDNVFPGINNTEGLNKARMGALLSSFDNKVDATYRNVLGSTYDSIKKEIKDKEVVDTKQSLAQKPVGSITEINGKKVKKVGQDQYEIVTGKDELTVSGSTPSSYGSFGGFNLKSK